MDATETLLALGAAAVGGFVVGAERERHPGASMAGARTFPFFAMAGALGMLLGPIALAVLGGGVVVLVAIAYARDIDADFREGIGMSTEVAALLTFGLGALCTAEDLGIAFEKRLLVMAAGTTLTLALLSFKDPLHHLVGQISRQELYATVELLLLLAVVLPLLPDEVMGPYDALNPRELGLLVVLIAGIGFVGYLAIRLLGPRRGLGLTGLLGGLVSSTAVTLTFAGRAREEPALRSAATLAIVLACSTMFPRVLVEIYAVSPALGGDAMAACVASGAVGLAVGAVLYARVSPARRSTEAGTEVPVRNPLSIGSALKFAGLFALVLIVANAAQEHLGHRGTYAAAVVSGATDVDAITLSLGRMHAEGTVSAHVALVGIGLAVLTNTVVKTALSFFVGGKRLGAGVAAAMAAALGAGALGLYFG